MPRFFVPRQQLPVITGSDAHQIKNVLRLQPGDQLEIIDGQGGVYTALITELSQTKVVCRLTAERFESPQHPLTITLAQCLSKGKKFDLVIQKATELGVAKIVPVLSERSLARPAKTARWQKIAKEAAEQSGRITVPAIAPLSNFSDVIKTAAGYDLALIPWELEKANTLKKVLKAHRPKGLLVLIGPEGGFSRAEVDSAIKNGFVSVSLGRRILRTETAPLALLAILNYEYE